MVIESSPTNLDPRVGVDAQSERIDELIFDSLVRRDEHFDLQPWLAERWEMPDPLTYIFHLRQGRAASTTVSSLTSRDVKWTFDSLIQGKLRSPKSSTYALVSERGRARRRNRDLPPEAALRAALVEPVGCRHRHRALRQRRGLQSPSHRLWAVPLRQRAAGQERHSGAQSRLLGDSAKLERVEFKVIPDATTRALELRKQSADVAINSLVADTVVALQRDPHLTVMQSPGTIYAYLALNLRDPILNDVRVRRAMAYAINVEPIIHYLLRDEARPAYSVLPPQHWAYDADVERYPHDPERARQILDDAGYRADQRHTLSPDDEDLHRESTRLLAAVLQQQLRQVGIALDIRTFEFATFFSDVTKGAYQMHSLRWIGGNQDPDIFEHIFDTASFAPKRANRTFYSNPRVDELIAEGRSTPTEKTQSHLRRDPADRRPRPSLHQPVVSE